MRVVTQQFLDEQNKRVSGGIRWSYTMHAESESFDLNPFLMIESLSTLDWRIEDELTEFVPPDIQFSLWFDQVLWDWLLGHENIILRVKERFSNVPGDELLTFWGYVDKDNLSRKAKGRVDVRAYGFSKHLSTMKTSGLFGEPLDPSYTVPIQWVVNLILEYVGIADRIVKVLPVDTYPNAETYVLSHLYASIAPTATRYAMLRIDETKFYFMDGIWLWLIAFNEDYSQISVTVVEYAWGGDAVRLERWGDNFAVIVGTYWIWQYKVGASWQSGSDWKATYLHVFDGNGVRQGPAQAISYFFSGSITYYPLARTIKHWDNEAGYVVFYHGCASQYQVSRSTARFFNDAHSMLYTYYQVDYYFHPWLDSTMGQHDGDYYLIGLCPTTNFSGPPRFLRLRPNYQIYYTTMAGQNVANFPEKWESIGRYVCFKSHTSAFNIIGSLEANFWPMAPNYLGRAVRQVEGQNPYHILTGYNTSNNDLVIKELDYASQDITTETVEDVLPSGFVALTGFTYWRTYKNKRCMIGMNANNNPTVPLYGVGILANQFHPFVNYPPLMADETIYDTLKSLAVAGCCIFHFPEEGKGIFISRAYWDPGVAYNIEQSLFQHNWEIVKREPVRVTVSSGSASGTVGGEVGELKFSSDYLPSYDENLLKAYAQVYYVFLSENPYEITLVGDFLIQFELFDQVIFKIGNDTYQGRIMQSTQEGVPITILTRSKKL